MLGCAHFFFHASVIAPSIAPLHGQSSEIKEQPTGEAQARLLHHHVWRMCSLGNLGPLFLCKLSHFFFVSAQELLSEGTTSSLVRIFSFHCCLLTDILFQIEQDDFIYQHELWAEDNDGHPLAIDG